MKRYIGGHLIRYRKTTLINDLKNNFFGTIKKYLNFLFSIDDQTSFNHKLKYIHNYRYALKYPKEIFKDVKYFVIFVCNPRSGHSLVGSLLDAHPNMVISHELNVLPYLKFSDYNYYKIYSMILYNSYKMASSANRYQTGYNYNVPYEYAGRYKTLKVIGDKKGEGSSKYFRRNPNFINELLKIFGKKLKIINVIRNPYDNISAISFRNNLSIKQSINRYFNNIEVFNRIRKIMPEDQVIFINHEALIENPKKILSKLCHFLDLDAPTDYLEACSQIIFKKPHSRKEQEKWEEEDIKKIESLMKRKENIMYFKYY
ncbi:MAG: sulfotransferase [Promethearchaeota archaeon]